MPRYHVTIMTSGCGASEISLRFCNWLTLNTMLSFFLLLCLCFNAQSVDRATDAIVKTLLGASKSILVQAYSFTSAPIAEALRDAHRRGVAVQVILDKSQKTEKYSSFTFLQNVGIPVVIDKKHAIAHNKVMIIDSNIVITGSFNFTKAAESRNTENLLIIRNKDIARLYTENWELCWRHGE